jgi:hypothetical protein
MKGRQPERRGVIMATAGKKQRSRAVWLFTTCIVFALVSESLALNTGANRLTLKGLQGVRVLVEEVASEIEKSGLTKNKLQGDVENQLKKAGIAVLSEAEVLKTPGEPYLYININAAAGKIQPEIYSYSIDIALIQNVFLERDPKANTYGITWSTGGVGITEKDSLNQLGESLGGIIDVFIESFQFANKTAK